MTMSLGTCLEMQDGINDEDSQHLALCLHSFLQSPSKIQEKHFINKLIVLVFCSKIPYKAASSMALTMF